MGAESRPCNYLKEKSNEGAKMLEIQKINESLKNLFIKYPFLVSVPPFSESSSTKLTFIGFTFSLRENSYSTKIYFKPERNIEELSQDIPEELKNKIIIFIQKVKKYNLKLYDISFEQNLSDAKLARMLWTFDSNCRSNNEYFNQILQFLLNDFGHEKLGVELIESNKYIQDKLHVQLSPLYLLGGVLSNNGEMSFIKANFDADVLTDKNIINYDNSHSLDITHFLLQKVCSSEILINNILKLLKELQELGDHIHSWGTHGINDKLSSVKIYVKSGINHNKRIHFICNLLKQYNLLEKVNIPSLDEELCPLGWNYYGFYLSIEKSLLNSIKFYFQNV